ncbi:polyketide cyclase/dehydrase/lipid transport protein [Streptomyces sp. 1114.5]|uniref:SRPBCC family protein n=1 Tax=Streptomyces sp. 1114.5 TaxID=1938830 RepID=UPI000EAFF3CD|nr:SRPBCC family protein [Streptomyces sp. 1114.5]RKT18542.1 polyketide cyclase/dehydrase/lipid transport protein [Streptomyces sp. 1114.5]
MAVLNIHERSIPAQAEAVGELIDGLAGADDRLWPAPDWPRMRFDGPLAVGASGGHGPVRYQVVQYLPGRWVRFRFSAPRGFHGFHEFTVDPADGGSRLRHTIAMRLRGPARLTWPLAFRRLHDALLEEALDRAVRACGGAVATPARRSPYVRLLRLLVHR